jgi:hypothetical protein
MPATVHAMVREAGSVSGETAAQLYLSCPDEVEAPFRRLAASKGSSPLKAMLLL